MDKSLAAAVCPGISRSSAGAGTDGPGKPEFSATSCGCFWGGADGGAYDYTEGKFWMGWRSMLLVVGFVGFLGLGVDRKFPAEPPPGPQFWERKSDSKPPELGVWGPDTS